MESHSTVFGDPLAAARGASLRYVNDAEPGMQRIRSGRGFRYLDAAGNRIDDVEIIDRIRQLAIPPAWTDVWIAPDAAGHVQATGRDQRGRKQYRYHPQWIACRDEAKFSSLVAFAGTLPKLRKTVDGDLRRHGIPRERVLAAIVWLLDRTMIRIGNEGYARENKSFGLTTLQSRHVDVTGSQMRFSFRGKSGQEWKLKISDRRIARTVKAIDELQGRHLFQYHDEDGDRHPIYSHDVNDYIREAAGDEFTSKHFRTWGATVRGAQLFAHTEPPDTKSGQRRIANRCINQIAQRLHNTRSVCRACYLHPAVLEQWPTRRLSDEIGDLRSRHGRPLKGLDLEESTVLRWLRKVDEGG